MSNKEALKAMIEGKKVRSKIWEPQHYIFVTEDGTIRNNRELVNWNEFCKIFRDTWEIAE